MCREVHACELADWAERIYVPGEIESEKRRIREAEGIPIDDGVRSALAAVARDLGITPSPFGPA